VENDEVHIIVVVIAASAFKETHTTFSQILIIMCPSEKYFMQSP